MFVGIVILCILVVVAYLVLLPLVRNTPDKPGSAFREIEDTGFDVPETQKEAVLSTINEIEFDYQMNKLSDNDYSQLKQEYRTMALELLHQEDEADLAIEPVSALLDTASRDELEDEIERELASLRNQRKQAENQ